MKPDRFIFIPTAIAVLIFIVWASGGYWRNDAPADRQIVHTGGQTFEIQFRPVDPSIQDRPIDFGDVRKNLTLAYRRQHSDPNAKDITIVPQMIILHWTAISSFDAAWKYFNNVRAESARTALANAGDVNVSTHFLVDRDGTIYRLMPETWMARHCIGLNHVAIGIENVGDGDKFPLTEAQAEANASLVRYLKGKYSSIEYLIGHSEYRKFEGTPLFVELDPKYRNQKPDPGPAFLEKVREKVKDLGLKGPEEKIEKLSN